MSARYLLLSPLSPREMLELEERVQRAVDEYLEQNPGCEDEWGEMSAGGRIPRPEEVVEAYRRYRLELPPGVLARLSRCRSAFSIDRPGDIETTGGLQVSILRYLLEQAGESMVLLNDYPFESSEQLLARLRKKPGARGFSRGAPAKTRKVARREAKPGELRALRILRTLEAAMHDVRVGIDVRNTLHSLSEGARRYGALLLEEGAVTDAKAALQLRLSRSEVATLAEELDRALHER